MRAEGGEGACARAVYVSWARKLAAALEDELDEVAERIADAEARIAAEDGGCAHAADMTPEPTPEYGAAHGARAEFDAAAAPLLLRGALAEGVGLAQLSGVACCGKSNSC